MLDIHSHLLPGVDDGPKTLAQSLELARIIARAGTTNIICTPHCHRGLRLMRRDIVPRVRDLNRALQTADIALQAFPGSEVQLWDIEAVKRDYEAGQLCLLGDDARFMLLEFSWNPRLYPSGEGAPDLVRWFLARGTQPILAHPERHDFLRERPERIAALVEAGAWLQLTVGSLSGEFGPEARAAAFALLSTAYPLVVASDSHGLHRVSGIEAGLQLVSEVAGVELAHEIRGRLQRIEDHITTLGAT